MRRRSSRRDCRPWRCRHRTAPRGRPAPAADLDDRHARAAMARTSDDRSSRGQGRGDCVCERCGSSDRRRTGESQRRASSSERRSSSWCPDGRTGRGVVPGLHRHRARDRRHPRSRHSDDGNRRLLHVECIQRCSNRRLPRSRGGAVVNTRVEGDRGSITVWTLGMVLIVMFVGAHLVRPVERIRHPPGVCRRRRPGRAGRRQRVGRDAVPIDRRT